MGSCFETHFSSKDNINVVLHFLIVLFWLNLSYIYWELASMDGIELDTLILCRWFISCPNTVFCSACILYRDWVQPVLKGSEQSAFAK